jgi:hypothetical protein
MIHLTGYEDSLREQIASQMQSVQSLRDIEQGIRESLHEVGKVMLALWLDMLSERYTARTWACSQCDGNARYERQRKAQMRTLL